MPDIEQHHDRGVMKLKQGDTLSAMVHFEKAVNSGGTADCLSYLGYCIAKERGQSAKGINLCGKALDEDPGNPLHHLNMAKIRLLMRDMNGAIEALRLGASCGENEEITAMLQEIGSRKPPLFSFLDRDHLLNRYCGIILARLRLR